MNLDRHSFANAWKFQFDFFAVIYIFVFKLKLEIDAHIERRGMTAEIAGIVIKNDLVILYVLSSHPLCILGIIRP